MLHFATYFDKNYLSRGLVLYESLVEHCENFELYVLCLDAFTFDYFTKNTNRYPEIKVLTLDEFEKEDGVLKECKSSRSKIEYYFTLSPCLPLYLLKKYKLPHICSLDADIMFYSNPQPLFEYLNNYSIVITPHKFSPEIQSWEEYGNYNVSFQIFKNDETGISCLEKWRQQCIEWCYDKLDTLNNRFADQKYLDEWFKLYPQKVKSLTDNISGLAVWNINKYTLSYKNKTFYSNDERLLFFHFHDFKILGTDWASNGFHKYKVANHSVLDVLYLQYWRKLENHNLTFGIGKDRTERTDLSKPLTVQLQNTIYVYFKVLNIRLIHINYSQLPNVLKKILQKIYG